ncbi:MAG: hypothetical protein IJC21_08930 [Lentisphaeria bacterium]|nr:hypothetical protein [Lentisphaeria bacterium]
MNKIPHRDRIALVRLVLEALPETDIDRQVSMCYMENYADIDIRIELRITKKKLMECRGRIREKLLAAAEMFSGE